jgi:hypothetical protein
VDLRNKRVLINQAVTADHRSIDSHQFYRLCIMKGEGETEGVSGVTSGGLVRAPPVFARSPGEEKPTNYHHLHYF